MACRNLSKAFDARSVLLRDYPNANVKIMSLDLADFKSIDNFISELKKIDIDCLVNNAGVFNQPNK